MTTTNDSAVAMYCQHMAMIDHIARHLADYSDDHGWLSPDAIDWTSVGTAGEIVALLTAACDRAGIDLTTDPDYDKSALAFAQPSMFPAGEDAPLFTLPEAEPDDQDRNCSRCNRHPAESGRAHWLACDRCGKPVCENCAWQINDGIYCSPHCNQHAD